MEAGGSNNLPSSFQSPLGDAEKTCQEQVYQARPHLHSHVTEWLRVNLHPHG